MDICQKVFNFIMSRGIIKRITCGQALPQAPIQRVSIDDDPSLGDQPPPPSMSLTKSNGQDMEGTFKDYYHSGSQIPIHFKQTDDDHLEPLTPVGAVPSLASSHHPVKPKERAEAKTRGGPKKVVTITEATDKMKGKSSSIKTESEKFTVPAEGQPPMEKARERPHLISVASNINEKSDAFIQKIKETLRSHSMEAGKR